jgi:hypothetical protein
MFARSSCTWPIAGPSPMSVVYFRRFRMEYDLAAPLFSEPKAPDG